MTYLTVIQIIMKVIFEKGNGLATETVNKLTERKSLNCGKVTDFQLYKAMEKVSEKLKENNIINI